MRMDIDITVLTDLEIDVEELKDLEIEVVANLVLV